MTLGSGCSAAAFATVGDYAMPRSPAARGNRHLSDVNRWRAWADARKDEAISVAQGQIEACRRCCECGGEVTLTERVCPHCGVRDPVRVPLGLSAVLGVSVVVAL